MARGYQVKIMTAAMTTITIITMTITTTMNIWANEGRFHFSHPSHNIRQFIVNTCCCFLWLLLLFCSFTHAITSLNFVLFIQRNLSYIFKFFEYSASIENNCGKWSSITWSWHWIWLPGRSSRCTGWTKSKKIQQQQQKNTHKIEKKLNDYI